MKTAMMWGRPWCWRIFRSFWKYGFRWGLLGSNRVVWVHKNIPSSMAAREGAKVYVENDCFFIASKFERSVASSYPEFDGTVIFKLELIQSWHVVTIIFDHSRAIWDHSRSYNVILWINSWFCPLVFLPSIWVAVHRLGKFRHPVCIGWDTLLSQPICNP